MASPGRPVLKRQNSKVRFSRADMSPVGTMASDSTVHGVPHRQAQPQAPLQGQVPVGGLYDASSYPFDDGGEEISLSESQDRGQEYEPLTAAEEQVYNPYDEGRYADADGCTDTPPRVGAARQWTQSQLQMGHPPVQEKEAYYDEGMISPRSTEGGFNHFGQGGSDPLPPQQQSRGVPGQQSEMPRSALRSSMVVNNYHASPPQPPTNTEAFLRHSPNPNSLARASVPSAMPQRRLLEQQQQQQHRMFLPASPQQMGSPRQGGSPQVNGQGQFGGSPFQHQSPRTRASIPAPNQPSAYPSYEEFARSSLVPSYKSRPSMGPESGNPSMPGNGNCVSYGGGRDDGWQGEDPHHLADRDRFDSDATLQAEYDEKKYTYLPQSQNKLSPVPRRPRSMSDDMSRDMHRRSTREVEADADDDDEGYHVKGGVFSQLLRLTGKSTAGMRRRISSRNNGGGLSRGASTIGGELPTMKSLGLRRADSAASTMFGADELDPDDPRVTGQKKDTRRRGSFSDLLFRGSGMSDTDLSGKRKRRASIQKHVADILTRQQFILKLAKALMTFGAPSHRVESQLSATALVLEIDAQFIHLPSIVIASFGDIDTRTSETHFVKAAGGLELGKLHKVHTIYRKVVHDELEAAEGTRQIHALLKAPKEYNLWQRIVLAFLCSGIIAPMGFGGSFIDGLAAGVLGILLAFMQLHVASKSAMYSNVFEISIATVVSFTARGLSTTGLFCYQAVASAGVVLILPGYTILCGSLELASKNIMSGSVRMVYAIIYSLFLGFGLTIGSDLFYVVDRPAKRASEAAMATINQVVHVTGEFTAFPTADSSGPPLNFNGTFTFSNRTEDAVNGALNKGAIICPRPDGLPWWQQGMPQMYLFLTVPLFSILLSLWLMQPWRSRQLPVMVFISCVGYLTNTLANRYIFERSDVVSAIGAFVIGILGNIYSRVFGGTAFTSMVPGVLFLVPSGISAAGGLAMSNVKQHDDSYSQGLIIGFRMVQVAIGITVGLFGSGLLIYSFGRKKGAALFAF